MLRAGQCLMLVVITLLVFGVVMVNSAGLRVAPEVPISLNGVLTSKPMILALMAIAAMAVGAFVPVGELYTRRGSRSPVPWIVVLAIVMLLATHLPVIGREGGGAYRWLNVGPLSFQPSEFAKWGLLIVVAWHCARRSGVIDRFGAGFCPPMILLVLICTLIGWSDLGTAALIFAVGVLLLLAAGARVWHVAMLAPIAVSLFVVAIRVSPYRMNRILAYLNPYDDPQGIGYHILQAMTAISGGGLAGRGIGNSIQKFGYLPEDTTDFIFAIICEELGVVGATSVIFLYLGLIVCGLAIVNRTVHPFQRLLGLGIVLTVGLQAMVNMAVVTAVAPTKGIALPLLSAGGTGWVLTGFSLGLLVSMDRDNVRREARGLPESLPAGVPA